MKRGTYLLGRSQDAGLPQAGCYCANCRDARDGRLPRGLAASLAIVDHIARASWIIDATPDFREQLHLLHELAPECSLKGIFLTHAHIGHYTGLMHLGRECMNTRALDVFATSALGAFLSSNGPWSQLVRAGNIRLNQIRPGKAIRLGEALTIEPLLVPHRDEYSDTVAYLMREPAHSLFYCPDIDRWQQWPQDLSEFLSQVNIALLDGTFFSQDELPNRNMAEVPHPLVRDTVAAIAGTKCAVRFIHLNHSNPLNREGAERDWLRSRGFDVAYEGNFWEL